MVKTKFISAVVGVLAAMGNCGTQALAVPFTDYLWTGGGAPATDWQVDGNWSIAGFPNDGLHAAILSVGSDLTVEVGATDVTVAALTLNGTNAGTDINIAGAGGGRLVLQNNDNNTYFDASPDDEIAPFLVMAGNNNGRVVITSHGAAGSTNQISSGVLLSNSGFLEGVDVVGSKSLTFSGLMQITGVDDDLDEGADFGVIRSYLPAGEKVALSGNIVLTDTVMTDPEDAEMDLFPRSLFLNSYVSTDHGTAGDTMRLPPRGTIEVSGQVSGTGGLVLGYTWAPAGEQVGNDPAPPPGQPLSTIILSGDNSHEGDTAIGRANVVVRHDNVFGTGTVRQSGHAGNSKEVGYNIVVDSGDRTIANNLAIVQWQTFKGTHSVEWSGIIYQDGTRGIINLLPYDHAEQEGETLTLSGPLYPNRESENPPLPGRIMTFDGSGKTVITGGIHNTYDDEPLTANEFVGSIRKRGTGVVVIDYDESNVTDTPSDYTGHTWVESGNLHFGTNDDLPSSGSVQSVPNEVLSTGGAIGVRSGVLANSTFLGMLNNSSNPTSLGVVTPFFYTFNDQPSPLLATYDHGGLMLGENEYGTVESPAVVNFSTGDLNNAASMSLAAWESGSTFIGTITPADSTYRLGGGSGKLTLPDANQLTGARNLLATNGGEVLLDDTNDYTGTTTIRGKFHSSLQEYAEADSADPDNDGDYAETSLEFHLGTTLTTASLANGGVNSSIGKSSNAAANLVIQGSTLKYVGGTASTDRLFTVGTAGASLDASGAGAVTFSNSGAVAIDVAEDRQGAMNDAVPGSDDNEIFGGIVSPSIPFDTTDLVPGMVVKDVHASPVIPDGTTLAEILSPHVVRMSNQYAGSAFVRTIGFGPAPARYLELTGSNTGDNTLNPLVGDASDRDEVIGGSMPGGPGGAGSVGIRKTGAGTWVLAAENTYTGQTQVQGGTLKVTGWTGTGDTIVSGTPALKGTLKGDGIVKGNLVVQEDGVVNPGLSPGELTVEGNYTQDVGGQLTIEIAGTGAAQYDRLTIDDGTGPVGLDGDYNGNDIVDAADYTVWRDALTAGSSSLLNDSTPGVVDESDFAYWRSNFGNTAGAGSNATVATLAGSIFVDLLSFSPTPGNMFTILTAGTVVNNGLTLTGESAGFNLVVNSNSVKLHYVGGGAGSGTAAIPEPSSILLGGMALVGLLGFSRGRTSDDR